MNEDQSASQIIDIIENYEKSKPSSSKSDENSNFTRIDPDSLPWKIVPQIGVDECGKQFVEHDYLDSNKRRCSDAESFSWKWSPDGRYGIDLPGGRDLVNVRLKHKMAVFDLHTTTWSLYSIVGTSFEIPRLAFLYWVRPDILVAVSLVKDYEPSPDEEVVLKFRQTFLSICHRTKKLEHMASCRYKTSKTISASYWYHIFENRKGEPFVDSKKDLWLIFSNGRDCLVLIPYIPTKKCFSAKYVNFDMNKLMGMKLGSSVSVDSFISSHYVPYVYQNEINFLNRVNIYSFIDETASSTEEEEARNNAQLVKKLGLYQMRFDLAEVLRDHGDNLDVTPKLTNEDIKLWRKLDYDRYDDHHYYSQHGKTLIISKFDNSCLDTELSKIYTTRISQWKKRKESSSTTSGFSLCVVDLDTDIHREFSLPVLGTDVFVAYPTGTIFMFCYKEKYGMKMSELPFFNPLPLSIKAIQAVNKAIKEKEDAIFSEKPLIKRRKTA